ncbi:MAG: hypothetical protein V4437_00350 [Patescibacteria group bacterium]
MPFDFESSSSPKHGETFSERVLRVLDLRKIWLGIDLENSERVGAFQKFFGALNSLNRDEEEAFLRAIRKGNEAAIEERRRKDKVRLAKRYAEKKK